MTQTPFRTPDETAEHLIACRPRILERWEAALRAQDGVAARQEHTPLRDRVPEYLAALADCLRTGQVATDIISIARAHGRQRTHLPSYSLEQILEEYRVLRAVIVEVLVEDGKEPDLLARERLAVCIEDALIEACVTFSGIHVARERRAATRRQQLLEIVSHDLRNPLQNIVTGAAVVERLAGDSALVPHLRRIRRAARVAGDLAGNLLDIAHIESGGLAVNSSEADLGALLRAALDRQREDADAASVRLELAPRGPGDADEVMADRDQILRVFDNVINNAVKFSPEQSTVHVSATDVGTDVQICIADSGDGIAPEEVAHIFERFWLAEREGRSGAGLGLTISKAIVEAHGGRMWVDSEPGRGTRVYFTLPRSGTR